MTKAPERIWAHDAQPDECNYIGGGWWDDACGNTQYPHMVEYVRADLVPQWQPIETAPKDGTRILAYMDGDVFQAILIGIGCFRTQVYMDMVSDIIQHTGCLFPVCLNPTFKRYRNRKPPPSPIPKPC